MEGESDRLSPIGKNTMEQTCYEEIPFKISRKLVDLKSHKKLINQFCLPVPISDTSPQAEKAKAMKQSLQGNSAN